MDQRRAVLVIYFISLLMGTTAVAIINNAMINVSILVVITSLMIFIPIYRTLGMENE